MQALERRHILGIYGEKIASDYLTKLGFQIIERNFRTRDGEIDIICEGEGAVVFVEVKTRNSTGHLAGLEAITQAKLKRIRSAIRAWYADNPQRQSPSRIDAISITVSGGNVDIDHLRQVN